MNGDERIYERLERLERNMAQVQALLGEHARRLDEFGRVVDTITQLREDLRRIEGRIEVAIARSQTWQTLVWAIIGLILGGLVAAGFELLKR